MFAAATTKRKKTRTRVQSLIFQKKLFTRKEAVEWARTHMFKASDVDETDETYRLRQRDPSKFKPNSFRTIDLTKGVQSVIGKLK